MFVSFVSNNTISGQCLLRIPTEKFNLHWIDFSHFAFLHRQSIRIGALSFWLVLRTSNGRYRENDWRIWPRRVGRRAGKWRTVNYRKLNCAFYYGGATFRATFLVKSVNCIEIEWIAERKRRWGEGVVCHLVKRCAKLRENEDGEEGVIRHLVKRCAKLKENFGSACA